MRVTLYTCNTTLQSLLTSLYDRIDWSQLINMARATACSVSCSLQTPCRLLIGKDVTTSVQERIPLTTRYNSNSWECDTSRKDKSASWTLLLDAPVQCNMPQPHTIQPTRAPLRYPLRYPPRYTNLAFLHLSTALPQHHSNKSQQFIATAQRQKSVAHRPIVLSF